MSKAPKIYVDSGPLIDLVKQKVGASPRKEREKDVLYLDRLIQAAQEDEIQMFTSVITIAECTHLEDQKKLEAAKPFFLGLLASGKAGFRLVQPTLVIAERARDLRWLHKASLSGVDSLHVASALQMGCDEILTGDGKILKHAKILAGLKLRVCRPSETSLLPPKFLQGKLSF